MSFTHGTELFKGDVASVSADVWGQAPALTYASAGFAAVLPDYLGLGLGPGPHPWMDVPSETTAALDMLRASRTAAAQRGRELRRGVLATGFSQGASAALGLARSLQEGDDNWFRLRAVAPVSGAYACRDAELPALLAGRTEPKAAVIYTAPALVPFNRLHHLYGTPARRSWPAPRTPSTGCSPPTAGRCWHTPAGGWRRPCGSPTACAPNGHPRL